MPPAEVFWGVGGVLVAEATWKSAPELRVDDLPRLVLQVGKTGSLEEAMVLECTDSSESAG